MSAPTSPKRPTCRSLPRSANTCARHPALAGAADRVGFYVGDIADVCARFEIDMTVLIIPSEAQVDNSLLASVRAKHFPSLGDEAFEILRPNRAVGEILSSRGIDVLDVTEAFQADARRLYRPRTPTGTLRATNWARNCCASTSSNDSICRPGSWARTSGPGHCRPPADTARPPEPAREPPSQSRARVQSATRPNPRSGPQRSDPARRPGRASR